MTLPSYQYFLVIYQSPPRAITIAKVGTVFSLIVRLPSTFVSPVTSRAKFGFNVSVPIPTLSVATRFLDVIMPANCASPVFSSVAPIAILGAVPPILTPPPNVDTPITVNWSAVMISVLASPVTVTLPVPSTGEIAIFSPATSAVSYTHLTLPTN